MSDVGGRGASSARKRRGVFPGTFDPITLGHIDIIERALSNVVDELVVAVYVNDRRFPLFPAEQRAEMIKVALARWQDRIEVKIFDGLFIDFARANGLNLSVRGVRSFSDFEYEFRMFYINNKMSADIETVFLPASEKHQYISSSFVREISSIGGDVSAFAPANVVEVLINKFAKR